MRKKRFSETFALETLMENLQKVEETKRKILDDFWFESGSNTKYRMMLLLNYANTDAFIETLNKYLERLMDEVSDIEINIHLPYLRIKRNLEILLIDIKMLEEASQYIRGELNKM